MANQQYRWNLRLKKSNQYLGTMYLGDPLPVIDDIIMIGDKKYTILELVPGSSRDASDVLLEASDSTGKSGKNGSNPSSASEKQ